MKTLNRKAINDFISTHFSSELENIGLEKKGMMDITLCRALKDGDNASSLMAALLKDVRALELRSQKIKEFVSDLHNVTIEDKLKYIRMKKAVVADYIGMDLDSYYKKTSNAAYTERAKGELLAYEQLHGSLAMLEEKLKPLYN